MGVSKNNDTPKSSILIGFSIINHPFWGTPIFGNTHVVLVMILVAVGFSKDFFIIILAAELGMFNHVHMRFPAQARSFSGS